MLRDRPILLLALGETLIWASLYYVFPAMLLFWEAGLGWSRAALTLGITLAVLASAAAAPLAGRLIDRGQGARLMGISAALGGVLLALLSQVSSVWQFHLLWLMIGLCLAGCLYEPCFAVVTRARGASARRAITAITLVAGFAGTISFPLVHALAEALGWRGALQAIGAFASLVAAPVLWAGAAGLEGSVRASGHTAARPAPLRVHFRGRVFWCLGLGFACLALVHGAVLHHLLPMLAERGIAPGVAVAAAALIGPAQVAGRIAMAAFGRRLSAQGLALGAFAGMGAAPALLLLAGSAEAGVFLAVGLFGAAYGTVSILRPVLARELLGEADFGAKSGGLALIYLAASASAAWLGALVWRAGGYALMLAILVALTAVGAALYATARRRARLAA